MGDKSGIQWTDATWNPTTGCDKVSPGCDHCYALTMAARLKRMGSARYQRDGDPRTSGPGFALTEHPDILDQPLRWTRPRRIFVNSMSDLFHQDVSDDFLRKVFDVMEECPRHQFQVLTKRPQRARRYLGGRDASPTEVDEGCELGWVPGRWYDQPPPPNIWLGTSIEEQHWAYRARYLLDTPAAVRFLSLEPLIGPVDPEVVRGVDWVIIGGESGPGARPMRLRWATDVIEVCRWAGIPVFMKQLGTVAAKGLFCRSHKGGDPEEWPEHLRVREYPA